MKRKLIVTGDGSHTISIPEINVTYHSIHGAIQESKHVFIETGLNYSTHLSAIQPVNIFEMGFGTGLNAFLSAIEAETKKIKIDYKAIDAFPISSEEAMLLNYPNVLESEELFEQIHQCNWNENVQLTNYFSIRKEQDNLINLSTPSDRVVRAGNQQFNLIYYDAFAPNAQPELWTKEIFEKLFNMLLPGGMLVTYCSKGDVRRAMMAAGFSVTKLPGPQGKREILRAMKVSN